MKKAIESLVVVSVMLIILCGGTAPGQEAKQAGGDLAIKYEELSAVEFISAVKKSGSTCIIPLGVMEKHGPHLPLGTDLLDVREVALRAAKKEYTMVFPEYYFSQIFEGKHQPGTIAYSTDLIWKVLQETCDELSRNGIKKIIIVNGHGGNGNFLKYFCQAQLANRRDYAVYLFEPAKDPEVEEQIKKLSKTKKGGHACEFETATLMAHRPDLVHRDTAKEQSGQDQKRLEDLENSYVGIWWYAQFPNHYAGDGSQAEPQLGELLINSTVDQLVKMIRSVKKDNKVIELQNRFFGEAEKPLETKQ